MTEDAGSLHPSDAEAEAAFEAGLAGGDGQENEGYRTGASPARGIEAPASARGAPASSPRPAAAAHSAAVAAASCPAWAAWNSPDAAKSWLVNCVMGVIC